MSSSLPYSKNFDICFAVLETSWAKALQLEARVSQEGSVAFASGSESAGAWQRFQQEEKSVIHIML